jgi:hypothetical protein
MTDTNANDDVISAFLDNEPFDPGALGRALAEPAGRDLLLDFIALRHLVTDDGAVERQPIVTTPRSRRRDVMAAAAVVAALAGGYAVGRDRAPAGTTVGSAQAAPEPTRVVELRPGVEWHPIAGGR